MRPRPTHLVALALSAAALVGLVPAAASAQGAPATPGTAPATTATPATPGTVDGTKYASYFQEHPMPAVNGSYVPVSGDFSVNTNYDDILWYAPGTGAESYWRNQGNQSYTSRAAPQVNGTYTPVVGDFAGSAGDDILWYAPGPGADSLWTSRGDGTFATTALTISGTYTPTVVEENLTTAKDQIIWAKAGAGSSTWTFTGAGAGHVTRAVTPPAGSKPVVGDYDDDGIDDVFWYGPGNAADQLWSRKPDGTYAVTNQSIGGSYTPVVNNFDKWDIEAKVPAGSGGPAEISIGDDHDGDDIFFYSPTGASTIWKSRSGKTWEASATTVGLAGVPFSPYQGILYVWSATKPDRFWYDGQTAATGNTEPGAGYQPFSTNFYGAESIFFYKPGPGADVVFS